MTITANGKPVLNLELREGKKGNWSCDLEVDSTTDLDRAVTIDFGNEEARFSGTVYRGGVEAGRWRGRVFGGRGGLQEALDSRYYGSTDVVTVLRDLASDTGETLDENIPASLKRHALGRWVRPEGDGRKALGDLATLLDVTWRVTREGTLWLGTDRYEPVEPETFRHQTLSQDPLAGSLVSAPDYPGVRPGVSFLGRKVANTVTTLRGGELRQVVFFEDEGGGEDRTVSVLRRLIEAVVGRRIDYSQSYPARVIRQTSDGLLEVIPDSPRIRGAGLTRLPIRLGLPGTRVEVAKGARVRVHFDEGDPSKPFAALWDTNPADVSLIEIGGDGAQPVTLEPPLSAYLADLKQWLDTLTLPTAMGPSGTPVVPSPELPDIASETLETT